MSNSIICVLTVPICPFHQVSQTSVASPGASRIEKSPAPAAHLPLESSYELPDPGQLTARLFVVQMEVVFDHPALALAQAPHHDTLRYSTICAQRADRSGESCGSA